MITKAVRIKDDPQMNYVIPYYTRALAASGFCEERKPILVKVNRAYQNKLS